MAAGADVNVNTPDGCTVLYEAASNGHNDIARVLLRGGADKNTRCVASQTPLYVAVYLGHLPIVDTLLGAGADVTIINDYGGAALHFAVDSVDLVSRLLRCGADENALDSRGMTPVDGIDDDRLDLKPQHDPVRLL